MARGLLDVAQGGPSVKGESDEGVPQGVGGDGLDDAGGAGQAADDAHRLEAAKARAGARDQERCGWGGVLQLPLPEQELDGHGRWRGQRQGATRAPLAADLDGPVIADDTEIVGTDGDCLADTQAAVEEEANERLVAHTGPLGSTTQGPDFATVEPEARAVTPAAGPADARGRIGEAGPHLLRPLVEAAESGEVAKDGCGGNSVHFKLADPALHMHLLGPQDVDVNPGAPCSPDLERGAVGGAGPWPVARQKRGDDPLGDRLGIPNRNCGGSSRSGEKEVRRCRVRGSLPAAEFDDAEVSGEGGS
jgi:hypothetical protein